MDGAARKPIEMLDHKRLAPAHPRAFGQILDRLDIDHLDRRDINAHPARYHAFSL
jgi:hypothetical protein